MNTPIKNYENRIIWGDCLAVMQTMPNQSVDFILTDPPYLVNYRSRDGRRYVNDDNDTWLKPAFAQAWRVLKHHRFLVSFCGYAQAEKFLLAWKAAGFYPLEHFVYVKSYASSFRYAKRMHEQAYLLGKGFPYVPKLLLPDVLAWKYTGDVLHPTQKPVSALKPFIAAFLVLMISCLTRLLALARPRWRRSS